MSSTSREVMPSAMKNATAVDAGSIREDMWNFGDEVGLDEFLSTIARNIITAADRFLENFSQPAEYFVTRQMTIRVVVFLEMVDIDDQHGKIVFVPFGAGHLIFQSFHQVFAIVQSS